MQNQPIVIRIAVYELATHCNGAFVLVPDRHICDHSIEADYIVQTFKKTIGAESRNFDIGHNRRWQPRAG